ncbi:MAG: hypothetical protein ABI785_05780 [Gemmatimonadales bacterium]
MCRIRDVAKRCALVAGLVSACSLGGDSPSAVVRKAGDALRTRNRAQFYDQVDLRALELPIMRELSAIVPDNYIVLGAGNGDVLGRQLDPVFASPPDTSIFGRLTANVLGLQFLGTEVSVRGVGTAQTSDRTAFVPVFIAVGADTTPRRVSIQLQKDDSRWRIVGVRDLAELARAERRRTAEARGELYAEGIREKAYVAGMKSDLRNVTVNEEAYFSDHGTYASDLAQIAGYRPSTGITVTITAGSDKGWAASARHDSLPKGTCSIFVGVPAPQPPPGSSSVPQEGAPYCSYVLNRQGHLP